MANLPKDFYFTRRKYGWAREMYLNGNQNDFDLDQGPINDRPQYRERVNQLSLMTAQESARREWDEGLEERVRSVERFMSVESNEGNGLTATTDSVNRVLWSVGADDTQVAPDDVSSQPTHAQPQKKKKTPARPRHNRKILW